MSRILGIDLGTTSACAAVFDEGTVQVIPNAEGSRTTPSVCAFREAEGSWVVGHVARREAQNRPANAVVAPLRLLDRRFDSTEVRRVTERAAYSVVRGEDGRAAVRIGHRNHAAVELCALVLMALKQAAESYLEDDVKEAVLCVPATFNERQRNALRDAAEIAGLWVPRVMTSATAAGLAYGSFRRAPEKVAVYDLGGGTFDISILELDDGVHQTLATGGDADLGGEEIDWLIVQWLAEELQKESGIVVTSDLKFLQRIKEVAESAKCALSTRFATYIFLPFAPEERGRRKQLRRVLTRAHLEQMMAPVLERTIEPCERALSRAGLSAQHIDAIIPIGGQTRAPRVLKTIRGIFGQDVHHRVNPDEAPAIGAAIQAAVLQGDVTDLVLFDVIPHSLGFETDEGTFVPVLERGLTRPTKKSVVATLDPARGLHVLERVGDRADKNASLGRVDLGRLGVKPSQGASLEITFDVDVQGSLEVSAEDRSSGEAVSTLVTPLITLSERDIEESRNNLRFQEDPESLRSQRVRWRTRLRELRDRVQEMFDAVAVELSERDRARIEANLVEAGRADDGDIEAIREAFRRLTVSLDTLETVSFKPLPLEDGVRLSLPDGVVEDFAASRGEAPEALRAVALNPEWADRYSVRYHLVLNPRTPLDVSMRFVDSLWNEDVEDVVRSRELPETLRDHARTILRMRLPPGPSPAQSQ